MGIRNHKGKWQVRFQMGGVAVTHNTGLAAVASNRNAALRVEAELRLAQRTGRRPVRVMPFNEAVDLYLEWAREELHPATWLGHKTSLTAWRVFVEEVLGGRAVADIHAGDVEHFKAWRRMAQIAPNTLHKNLCVAGKAWRWFARQGWCAENPVAGVQRPPKLNVRECRVLTDGDEAAYLAEAALRSRALHDLAILMLDTGMRPEEVLRARVEDVDLVERILTVQRGKTAAARRRLWLSDRALAVVAERVRGAGADGWLWPSPRYEGMPMTKLNGPHEKVLLAIQAAWTLYDFRHTFATRCAESGMDVATLAAVLGHSGLRVVLRYVHPTPAHQVEMMQAAIRKVGTKVRRAADSDPGEGGQAGPTSPGEKGQVSPHVLLVSEQANTRERRRSAIESTEVGGAGRN